LIDRLRQEIQERLDQLLDEADKLRHALAALSPRGGSSPAQPKAPASSRASSPRKRARPVSSTRSGSADGRRSKTLNRASGARGQTKSAVLAALGDGTAMTAGEVAAATGLARATVSTTLSKLAKSGDVLKAQRGYRLPTPGGPGDSPVGGR
jgi:DNA-binding transcriptional ArsR family regulator